ncbi:SRPBCC family protein [Arthrobacter sp. Hor0625]|uniref:SRPBCC family protein n=1 Tax=Arthrobacter sp. Hor0625 TaxID=3457358 RepID=UPI00403ED993
MATVQESIAVNVPLSQAYNQWTQFEDFPQFMSGVDAVRQLDDTTVHFQTSVGGVRRDYDARITSQDPDRQVSWESLDAPRNAGTVRFAELGPAETRVDVELSWEPGSATEKIGAAVGLDSRQVAADLKRFKDFIEGRDFETGAWRDRVTGGQAAGPGGGGTAGASAGTADGLTPVSDPAYDVVGAGAPVNADPDLATEPPSEAGSADAPEGRPVSDR